jgi:hypothetical protein
MNKVHKRETMMKEESFGHVWTKRKAKASGKSERRSIILLLFRLIMNPYRHTIQVTLSASEGPGADYRLEAFFSPYLSLLL